MGKPPLEDPSYEPKYPPVDGKVPDVVAEFGPATQIRWFRRFLSALDYTVKLSEYYVTSGVHKGPCCGSCIGEYVDGYQGGGVIMDGWCCCRGIQ
jgi:hypothetical protein